ncbi:MAG: hypothetical protein GX448_01320 [Planctomycetes bacterium]|nr:hypothetical protein [Planctomycetota bacterium]
MNRGTTGGSSAAMETDGVYSGPMRIYNLHGCLRRRATSTGEGRGR